MIKTLSLALTVLLALLGTASAATLDVTLGNTGLDALGFNTAGAAINPNINLNTPSPASLTLNFNSVLTNSSTSQHSTPTGSLFGGNYLAVIADGGTGLATLTLAPNENTLSFTWGTIDGYNTLTLTDSRAQTYAISGSQILSHLAGSIPGTTQSDVSFFDPFGQIVSAQLTSSLDAFETANFDESKTSAPLPETMVLFASALFALFLLKTSRAQKQS